MNKTSVESRFNIAPSMGQPTYAWTQDNIVEISFNANFTENTTYYITISELTEDVVGNQMQDDFLSSFTTWKNISSEVNQTEELPDSDEDGIPDVDDPDDDNDGFLDEWEIILGTDPLDIDDTPLDTDDDGVPDGGANNTESWMDTDDDDDGVPDTEDFAPLDPDVTEDPNNVEINEPLLTKYWWIILIFILVPVVLVVVYMMKKKQPPEETPESEESEEILEHNP